MASRVVMPKLTDTMTEGVLIKWYKHEGDHVESGDVLAEIETDKAVMDLEAYASGVMRKILVGENATVPAGCLIAVIAAPNEDIASILANPSGSVTSPESSQAPPPPKESPPADRTAKTAPLSGEVKASPLARKIAQDRGIDLGTVRGSGPGGRIVEKDLEAAGAPLTRSATSPAVAAAPGERVPLSQMRKAIVRNMTASKAPVPHFYLTAEVDMERAADLIRTLETKHPDEKTGYNDLIIKACALALAKHPRVNASFVGDGILVHEEVRVGVAVGLDDGLIVPVIRNCEKKTLRAIASEARNLVDRARNRKLKPEEYTGATFSISNLGKFDIDQFSAIITPPEAAVLAVGSVKDAAVVAEGRVMTARKRMMVTLSCDHRVVDGMQGAIFLQDVKRILENVFDLMAE